MDFYYDNADERKEGNEKTEIETRIGEKRNRRRNERKAEEERKGCYWSVCQVFASLHYITKMLQHWWHCLDGRGLALGMMSLTTNQRSWGTVVVVTDSWGWNSRISEKVFFLLSNHGASVSCVLFPGVIFRLLLKQIYFRPVPVSAAEQRVNEVDSK